MAAIMCNVCGKRRPYTGNKGTETASHGSQMCNYCAEEGSWENEHNDNNHAGGGAEKAFTEGCWICHPEKNLAQKPVGNSTGPKVQGARRPQLNHKGHSHPQTPAARRACKQAFWAVRKEQGITPVNVEAPHFAAWDFNCDGHGKQLPIDTVKPGSGWVGVAPLGPKGGTGASVKAAGAKAQAITKKAKASK